METKTVQEIYYLNEQEMEDMIRFSKTDYIQKSLKFYRSVKHKPLNQLSPKQIDWLNRLRTMLEDRERKRVQKNIKYTPQKKFTLWPKKTSQGWVWLTYYE